MIAQIKTLIMVVFLVGAILILQTGLRKNFSFSYSHFTEVINLSASKKTSYGLLDLSGIILGMRRMAADIAWIQLMQYYGTPETDESGKEIDFHGEDYGGGKYYEVLSLTQRVIRLDPYFHYAYLYSAGALAWNLNRPEEAISLLKEGISNDPKYWRFRLYLGAIIYLQLKKFDKMVILLEEAVKYPDCPSLVKVILANIYEEEGRYLDCLKIWFQVLESKDEFYRLRAKKKTLELRTRISADKT